MAKQMPEPIVVLKKGEYTQNIYSVLPKGRSGEMEKVVRNMCLLDCAEDGSYIRLWASTAFSAEDNCVWYPTWIFDKVTEKREFYKNEYGELVLPASEREGDEDFWKSAYERKYGKLE